MKEEFFSKDDLDTFEGYFRYQGIDAAASTPEELTTWRGIFDDVRNRSLATPKVGLMKLQRVPGKHLYAVAVREDSDLWLALWGRRSWKGDCIFMGPFGDSDWDVHTTYHRNGAFHMKRLRPKNAARTSSPLTPLVVARKLMASRSQQSSAKATRTRLPLSQPISKPSEHQRRLRSSTAMRPAWRPRPERPFSVSSPPFPVFPLRPPPPRL